MGMADFMFLAQIHCFEQKSANQTTFKSGFISIGFAWDRVQNKREDTPPRGPRHAPEAWSGKMNIVFNDYSNIAKSEF
jgi:hypothetical protein